MGIKLPMFLSEFLLNYASRLRTSLDTNSVVAPDPSSHSLNDAIQAPSCTA